MKSSQQREQEREKLLCKLEFYHGKYYNTPLSVRLLFDAIIFILRNMEIK